MPLSRHNHVPRFLGLSFEKEVLDATASFSSYIVNPYTTFSWFSGRIAFVFVGLGVRVDFFVAKLPFRVWSKIDGEPPAHLDWLWQGIS
jgi:hypothetical protein